MGDEELLCPEELDFSRLTLTIGDEEDDKTKL